MILENQKILMLSPHTDDVELGCGATVSRLLEEGNEIFYIAFSICEESVPDGFPRNQLETECKLSTSVLGLKEENVLIERFPVRKFGFHRQEILEYLVSIRKKISPDIVFMPNSYSIHQDHKVIYEEGLRAFNKLTCFGYELPWDSKNFSTDVFFRLTSSHMEKKELALKQYKTQEFRSYWENNLIRSLASIRGMQVNTKYAEAYELIRMVI